MTDVLTILAIVSGIVGVIVSLSLHLRSNCCGQFFSFDIDSKEQYEERLKHHDECKTEHSHSRTEIEHK